MVYLSISLIFHWGIGSFQDYPYATKQEISEDMWDNRESLSVVIPIQSHKLRIKSLRAPSICYLYEYKTATPFGKNDCLSFKLNQQYNFSSLTE